MSHPVSVEIKGASLSFGPHRVLRDIHLRVEPGEFFALLGPSGCGKSTLLRLIAGFNPVQRGTLLIDGEDLSDKAPWQRNIGMVFQSYALWPHMSVAQNVAFGLEERRLARPLIEAKVREMLELVGLAGMATRRPSQLSGGQQQRVALARTLAIEPRVLLLDEPLSNLDAKLRVHMRRELLAMQRKLGITTLFVTHDQEEALTTADRIAVMNEGVVQQIGTPVELYDRPLSRFVAEFIGSTNLITARRSGAQWLCEFGVVADPAAPHWADEVVLALRPSAIALAPQTGDNTERVWRPAQVLEREFLGGTIRYCIRVGSLELLADQPHEPGMAGFMPGDRIAAGIDTRRLIALPG